MKKHIIIAPEFAIDSSIIKSIREKITGICSSTKLQITLDEISHSEAENVIQYLNSIGKFKVILDEDYYSSEELLNFDYFYCSENIERAFYNFDNYQIKQMMHDESAMKIYRYEIVKDISVRSDNSVKVNAVKIGGN